MKFLLFFSFFLSSVVPYKTGLFIFFILTLIIKIRSRHCNYVAYFSPDLIILFKTMIQKFTCVPITDYDVTVVSDGTRDQINAKLSQIKDINSARIPKNSHITYLPDFPSLCHHLDDISILKMYNGKVYFMFFNSLEFVQEFIWDVLETYGQSIFNSSLPHQIQLKNAYFYFGLVQELELLNPFITNYTKRIVDDFNTVAMMVSDVLNKMGYMLGGVKAVYIDDIQLVGERSIALKKLMRNYPKVEKFELASLC